jgi:hypothetical protein
MYLFARRARVGPGHVRDALASAVSITETVNRITGLRVGLFSEVFSPEPDILSWSTFVPDLATIEVAMDKLMADEGYISDVENLAQYTVGGPQDALAQIVYGEPDPNRQVEYASVANSVLAVGGLQRGTELGIKIAQKATEITGVPSLFLLNTTGSYGGVAWVSGYANVQELQQASEKIASDPSFLALIDNEAPGAYSTESTATIQTVFRRLV